MANETAFPMVLKKRVAGLYVSGDWTFTRTESNMPGYRWVAHHVDHGEFHYDTLRSAVLYTERLMLTKKG
jgi:hypothetical protein